VNRVIAVLALILLAVDLLLNLAGKKYRKMTKGLLMPLLLVYYLMQAESVDYLVVLAIFAAFAGDVCLLWLDRPMLFQAGLLSFLLGHCCYALVFWRAADGLQGLPGGYFLLLLPYGLAVMALYRHLESGLAGRRLAFILYACSIAAMSLLALARLFVQPGWVAWLPFAGSLLFMLSDSLLAANLFGPRSRHPAWQIMASYVAAQVLIVAGLAMQAPA